VKYFPLLWSGIWRRRGRTILTLLSIVNAFLLLGLLNSFTSGIANVAAETRADSLITRSKISMLEPLPVGLTEQIRSVPGVKSVTPLILFPTSYQNQVQGPLGLGADVEQYFAANPTLVVSKDVVAAMKVKRAGAIIGPGLVERYGWKVGDHIPVKSALWANRDGSNIWAIDIVGVYKATDSTAGNNVMVMNYDYIDEGRQTAKGTANWFALRVSDPSRAAAISTQIDRLFDNSPHETKTSTSQQLAQDQLSQIGDIGFVVNAIAGAVFFALLFYVGTVMVQSVRERTSELAVLKALGFTDRAILMLIVSEALLLCVFAAMLGLLLSSTLFSLAGNAIGFPMKAHGVILRGLLLAASLALLTGLPPAWRAMRLSVVEALAGK
jgi:putative ABC transport system permease protein